ncbi:MAG: SsrA-binding protein SmpB [Spirochaetaceae bacterium]|nr:SsrA-binding protein SmpB [Spirochaetaceae bacterium]
MAKNKENQDNFIAKNRKAYFNYEVLNELECGIELKGTEVKSVRAHRLNFVDSYCEVKNGELYLLKLNISPYDFGNIFNHAAERPRRLLAHKKEIIKLERQIREKGITLIPLAFYFKNQKVKVKIGLCRGKKLYDKRESIKQKDLVREGDRKLKYS